jgi:hypothetical protein
MRSIAARDTSASVSSCGRGRGPRSACRSSCTRLICCWNFSRAFLCRGGVLCGAAGDCDEVSLLHARMVWVFCLRSSRLWRMSTNPRRSRRGKKAVFKPSFVSALADSVPCFAINFESRAISSGLKSLCSMAACELRNWRPASVSTICCCDFTSVTGGSMARKTSPTGAR